MRRTLNPQRSVNTSMGTRKACQSYLASKKADSPDLIVELAELPSVFDIDGVEIFESFDDTFYGP